MAESSHIEDQILQAEPTEEDGRLVYAVPPAPPTPTAVALPKKAINYQVSSRAAVFHNNAQRDQDIKDLGVNVDLKHKDPKA